METRNSISVRVMGDTGIGKSTICEIIEKALSEAGIKVSYENPDGKLAFRRYETREPRLQSVRDSVEVVVEEWLVREVSYKIVSAKTQVL